MTEVKSETSLAADPPEVQSSAADLFDDALESAQAVPQGVEGGSADPTPAVPLAQSAGQLLQQLRQRADMSVNNLAATLKVSPNAVLALEADNYSSLPDMVFARALAASICRTLKADSATVLQVMPQIPVPKGQVGPSVGLNLPMSRPVDFSRPFGWLKNPSYLLVLAIVVAILVVLNWTWVTSTLGPWLGGVSDPQAATRSSSAADSVLVVPAPSASAVGMVTTEVTPLSGPTLASGAAQAGTLALNLSATAASWIEVSDSAGNSILKKQLAKGESVIVAAPLDAKLVIGNAAATVLSVNGKPVDLSAHTVANIARLSLK